MRLIGIGVPQRSSAVYEKSVARIMRPASQTLPGKPLLPATLLARLFRQASVSEYAYGAWH